MSSQIFSLNMVVNAWFVSQEIVINIKWSFNWAICHNLCLNLSNILWNCKNFFSIMQVFLVFSWVICSTRLLTFWSWLYSTTWFIFSSCMMIAWGETISFTPICCVEEPPSWQTAFFIVSPCGMWPTSAASHTTANPAATDQIFSRNSGLLFLSACNTNSITHGFNSTKGPTWTTCTLISDLLYWLTVRPLDSRIKILWNTLNYINLFNWQFELLRSLKCTHKANDILHGSALEIFVLASFPSDTRSRVDSVD